MCPNDAYWSYDDEPRSFRLMEQFCEEENLTRIDLTHKEI